MVPSRFFPCSPLSLPSVLLAAPGGDEKKQIVNRLIFGSEVNLEDKQQRGRWSCLKTQGGVGDVTGKEGRCNMSSGGRGEPSGTPPPSQHGVTRANCVVSGGLGCPRPGDIQGRCQGCHGLCRGMLSERLVLCLSSPTRTPRLPAVTSRVCSDRLHIQSTARVSAERCKSKSNTSSSRLLGRPDGNWL